MHYLLIITYMLGHDIVHQDKYGLMTEAQCTRRAHAAEQQFSGPVGDTRMVTACIWRP